MPLRSFSGLLLYFFCYEARRFCLFEKMRRETYWRIDLSSNPSGKHTDLWPMLYPLKTKKRICFPGIFKVYKMGPMARNWLPYLKFSSFTSADLHTAERSNTNEKFLLKKSHLIFIEEAFFFNHLNQRSDQCLKCWGQDKYSYSKGVLKSEDKETSNIW